MPFWDKVFGSSTTDNTMEMSQYSKLVREQFEQQERFKEAMKNQWTTTSVPTSTMHHISAAELAARQQEHMNRAMQHDDKFLYAKGEILKQIFNVWDGVIPNEQKPAFVQGIEVRFTRSESTFSFIAKLKFDMPGSVQPIDLHIRFEDGQINDRNLPDMRADIEQWLIKARMLKEISDNKNG